MTDLQLLSAVLRTDFAMFIEKVFNTIEPGGIYMHNWHIDVIAHVLQECYHGRIKRLIITLPPRYLKSISASVAFPAWMLGNDPSRKIICASYANDLAIKHSLDTRTIMLSDWYQRCFPNARLHGCKNTESEFVTTLKGFRLATSVGGSLTGRGANTIIIDDPHKADEVNSELKREAVLAWFRNTVLTRLDNKLEDCIIVIQQRLHENDLAGSLLAGGGWYHLNIPAIAEAEQMLDLPNGYGLDRPIGSVLHPEREPKEALDQMKASMGSYAFAAQYQQNRSPSGGGIVKWEWFKQYDHIPDNTAGAMIIQSWDTASKIAEHNDYSVCMTCLYMNGKNYILEVFRERLEYPALKAKVIGLARHWKANIVLMEDSSAGSALIQDLRQSNSVMIMAITPKADKKTRMMEETPAIEAGRVYVPKEEQWLADFQRELVVFPNGKHDDQVDSLSQYLYYVRIRDARNNVEFKVTLC